MRILVDECLPRQLRYWLERIGAFEVSTVQDEGWTNVKNGKLLRAANDAGFDVLLTADKNMHYQQNFEGLGIASVVVPTNRKKLVEKCIHALQQSLEQVQLGQKVVMDLGDDASVWHLMKIHAIERGGKRTTRHTNSKRQTSGCHARQHPEPAVLHGHGTARKQPRLPHRRRSQAGHYPKYLASEHPSTDFHSTLSQ